MIKVGLTRLQKAQLNRLNEKFDDMSQKEWDKFTELDNLNNQEHNFAKLDEIAEEACDRIWFDRCSIGTDAEPEGIPEDIREKALAAQIKIMEMYELDPEDCDDFYHGYWSGILALSRFLLGWSDDMEDLREGTGELLTT